MSSMGRKRVDVEYAICSFTALNIEKQDRRRKHSNILEKSRLHQTVSMERITDGGVEQDPNVPGPALVSCHDNGHCAASSPGAGVCLQVSAHTTCAGLATLGANLTPRRSKSSRQHSLGIRFCRFCKHHERVDKNSRVDTRTGPGQISMDAVQPAVPVAGAPAMSWGARADLCERCIGEEMKLYWDRVGKTKPGNGSEPDPATISTLHDVAAWPRAIFAAGNDQDLCICHQRTVARFQRTCCHACRDKAFQLEYLSEARETENILRERKKQVITGKRLCDANGGNAPYSVPAAEIAARVARGVGRMCPCGNEPVPLPRAAHFIDVCLACSGVRVDPTNIPPQYQRARMLGTRHHPTRGPRRVKRDWNYRVNIELAWRSADPGDDDPWIADR